MKKGGIGQGKNEIIAPWPLRVLPPKGGLKPLGMDIFLNIRKLTPL